MAMNSTRLAAQAIRALPRKHLSRLLGRVALLPGPTPVLNAAIAAYVRAYGVDMGEVEVPQDGFRSFDEFFTRRLKPGAREIDPDRRALVSPADGRIEGFGRLTENAELVVKGMRYTAGDLLGDAQEAIGYQGGHYFVVYLSPMDYHRVHAPTSGSVQQVRYVPGTLFPVNRIGSQYIPQLLARNERIAIVQESEVHGAVTTILVGAIGVGRIGLAFDELQTNSGYTVGTRSYADAPISIDRGDELGVFHVGSTVIVMTPPECTIDVDLEVGGSIRMGEAMGIGGLNE
jgi:phosphatidylserine decarboxylase